jgi:hypothetical protein
MAIANSTLIETPLDRLKEREHCYGRSYFGTEADLVAAGLIKPEWFPGKPGNPKHTVHVGVIDGAMRVIPYLSVPDSVRREKSAITIFKQGKKFRVCIDYTDEERARMEVKKKMEKLQAEKREKLESAPKNPEEFLNDRTGFIKPVLEQILNQFRRAKGGFHYSSHVAEEARDLILDLIALAENGKVYFDPKRHRYFLDDVDKAAAQKAEKEFPEFSAFMAATLAIGKAAVTDEV